jgi:CxxC-x17-CxxC domain-containing protein
MNFQDRRLDCVDCGGAFVFSAGEQQFHTARGFTEAPKRCEACRAARKSRHVFEHGEDRPRSRPQREMFDASCASCGVAAKIPFRPATGRPVYCRECYGARQSQGSGHI